MAGKDLADWAEVRRAYEEGDANVLDICAQFGVSRSALYLRVRRERWTMRHWWKSPTLSDTGDGVSDPFALSRMLKKAQGNVRRRIERGDDESTADLERHVRMVKSLVSTAKMVSQIEGLTEEEIGAVLEGQAADEETIRGMEHGDADAMRRELARRIEEIAGERED